MLLYHFFFVKRVEDANFLEPFLMRLPISGIDQDWFSLRDRRIDVMCQHTVQATGPTNEESLANVQRHRDKSAACSWLRCILVKFQFFEIRCHLVTTRDTSASFFWKCGNVAWMLQNSRILVFGMGAQPDLTGLWKVHSDFRLSLHPRTDPFKLHCR